MMRLTMMSVFVFITVVIQLSSECHRPFRAILCASSNLSERPASLQLMSISIVNVLFLYSLHIHNRWLSSCKQNSTFRELVFRYRVVTQCRGLQVAALTTHLV